MTSGVKRNPALSSGPLNRCIQCSTPNCYSHEHDVWWTHQFGRAPGVFNDTTVVRTSLPVHSMELAHVSVRQYNGRTSAGRLTRTSSQDGCSLCDTLLRTATDATIVVSSTMAMTRTDTRTLIL